MQLSSSNQTRCASCTRGRERRWFVLKRPRRDTNGGSETEVTEARCSTSAPSTLLTTLSVLQLLVQRHEVRADSSSGCDRAPHFLTQSNKLLLRSIRQRHGRSDHHALPGATRAPSLRHLPLRTRRAHGRALAAEAPRGALATGAGPAVGGVAASGAGHTGCRTGAGLVRSCRVGVRLVGCLQGVYKVFTGCTGACTLA